MKIAFLGCGSMGEAIMTGLLSSESNQRTVVATTRTEARAAQLRASHDIVATSTAETRLPILKRCRTPQSLF